MKAVAGKIVSSTPVSLSKAAKIISKFAETENGASQAVKAYLRRSAASFNELRKLHRELEASSKHKQKRAKSEASAEAAEEPSQEPVRLYEDGEPKKHKKKRKKEKIEDANSGDYQGNLVVENGEKVRDIDPTKELSEETKHKKEVKSGDEIGVGERNGGQLEHKKKRKGMEMAGEKENGSSEKPAIGLTVEQSEGKKHKKDKESVVQVSGVEDGGEFETKGGKRKRKRKETDGEKENDSSGKPTHDCTEKKKKKHHKEEKIGDQLHVAEDGLRIGIKEEKKRTKGVDIDEEKDDDLSEKQHTKKKRRKKAEAEG